MSLGEGAKEEEEVLILGELKDGIVTQRSGKARRTLNLA